MSQLKGKEHIKYIRQLAVGIWKGTGFMEGQFIPSIRIALRRHREAMATKKNICTYPTCIICKKFLEQGEVYHYTRFCYACWGKNHTTASSFQRN